LGIDLKEGVYCQLTGPSFETPAEIRLCSRLGADAVGMSTAVEAIAAGHMGMKVCCVSCISNKAAGLSGTKLTHEEVQETADRVSASFKLLVSDSIARMKAKGLFA
jgi:purine-nucleoside phosphorylase